MVATCYSRIVSVQAAPPKGKGFTSAATTNTPSSQVFSVVQPCSILDFKHCKLKLRSSFVSSRVNHTQLLSYLFLHHSTSRNMMPSRSQEAANGSSRSNGNVAHPVRTMKPLADLDGNGQQAEGLKPSGMVVCFGEMLVDFVPTVGGLSLAKSPAFKKSPGGAPANVAVGIARLGGSSAFIGKVGEDEFGHMLAALLEENGVESRGIRFDTGARTALAFVTLKDDGEREFMFYRNPSADMLLEKEELDIELVQQAAIFHYGSISLIAEPCRSAQLAALEAAKKAGVLLSYDINLRLPLWPSADAARQGIRSIWEQADIIKVSEDEISFLTEGTIDPYGDEAALKLWHPNLKLLLVTEGSAGCRYYCKDFSGRVGTMNVTPVDTTGAGDAFVAGLLYQLVRDMSMLEDEPKLRYALKFANACGAITTTERGAIPAFPTMNTVLRLIDTGKIVRDIIPR